MKIVKRSEFLKMPAGTLFSKYRRCWFDELMIKGGTTERGNDFYEQSIAGATVFLDTSRWADALVDSEENGTSLQMDFYCEGRDALYEDADRLFAVWERADVEALIARLKETL